APDSPEFMRRGLEGSGLGLAYAERVLGLAGGAIDPAGIDDEAGVRFTFMAAGAQGAEAAE
ncbi:MAG: hypothetical protein AB7P02_26765, partial [Alphaproteobacteria bacterium]